MAITYTPQDASRTSLPTDGSPALLVKTVASYTGAAIYKDEAFQTRKALSFSSLNILTQKSSPKVRENLQTIHWCPLCERPAHSDTPCAFSLHTYEMPIETK